MCLFVAIILLSLFFRAINIEKSDYWRDIHTLSVMSDLAIGGLLAYTSFYFKGFRTIVRRIPISAIILIYVLGSIMIVLHEIIFQSTIGLVVERLIISIFFAFIIAEQNYSLRSIVKIGKIRFLDRWGKYTYGLYCLHYLAIFLVLNITIPLHVNSTFVGVVIVEPLLSLVLSLAISFVSYRYFEMAFLQLKKKFSYIVSGQ